MLRQYYFTLRRLGIVQIYYLVKNRLFNFGRLWRLLSSLLGKKDRYYYYEKNINFLFWRAGYNPSSSNNDLDQFNSCYMDTLQLSLDASVVTSQYRRLTNQLHFYHPYTTSLRLVNIIKYIYMRKEQVLLPDLRCDYFAISFNLEKHLGANHLLANYKALIFYQSLIKNKYLATRFGEKFIRLVRCQFDETGTHYELSPMYQGHVLTDLIDIYVLDKSFSFLQDKDRSYLRNLIIRAYKVYADFHGSDGSLAKFNDCANNTLLELNQVIQYIIDECEIEANTLVQERTQGAFYSIGSGFYALEVDEKSKLLIDLCEVKCASNPGHKHASTLSFELWKDGIKIFNNLGTFNYEVSPRRALERSSLAYNKPVVIGKPDLETWGSFRVAALPCVNSSVINEQRIEGRIMFGDDILCLSRTFEYNDRKLKLVDLLTDGTEECKALFHTKLDFDIGFCDSGAEIYNKRTGVKIEFIGSNRINKRKSEVSEIFNDLVPCWTWEVEFKHSLITQIHL